MEYPPMGQVPVACAGMGWLDQTAVRRTGRLDGPIVLDIRLPQRECSCIEA